MSDEAKARQNQFRRPGGEYGNQPGANDASGVSLGGGEEYYSDLAARALSGVANWGDYGYPHSMQKYAWQTKQGEDPDVFDIDESEGSTSFGHERGPDWEFDGAHIRLFGDKARAMHRAAALRNEHLLSRPDVRDSTMYGWGAGCTVRDVIGTATPGMTEEQWASIEPLLDTDAEGVVSGNDVEDRIAGLEYIGNTPMLAHYRKHLEDMDYFEGSRSERTARIKRALIDAGRTGALPAGITVRASQRYYDDLTIDIVVPETVPVRRMALTGEPLVGNDWRSGADRSPETHVIERVAQHIAQVAGARDQFDIDRSYPSHEVRVVSAARYEPHTTHV